MSPAGLVARGLPALLLCALAAGPARAACPPSGLVTALRVPTSTTSTTALRGRRAFVERRADSGLRFAVVAEGVPLGARSLADERVVVAPLEGISSLAGAAQALRAHTATCAAAEAVRAGDLVSPVDGLSPSAPILLPELGLVRGATHAPSEDEARLGRVFDLATVRGADDARPPVRARAAEVVTIPEGRVLALALVLDAAGATTWIWGPVVSTLGPAAPLRDATLGAAPSSDATPSAAPARDTTPSAASSRALTGRAAIVRAALDDPTGRLEPGDVVTGSAPGLGALRAVVAPYEGRAWAPPDPGLRFAVAHGAATGLSLASISLSLLDRNPGCVVLCDAGALGLPADRSFTTGLAARTDADLAVAARALDAVELTALGVSLATVLVPSGRRGVLSRVELLEDVLVLGESWLVGWTTPLTLQARLGRARPKLVVRGGVAEGRDAVTAPLFAPRTTAVASVASAATSLLVVEEAPVAWTIPAAVALGGLTAATAYLEVRAGDVFPSDVPLALVGGAGSGLAVVLWHTLFWRGWPGSGDRGALPLRLVAAPADGGPRLALTGVF